MEQPFFFSYFCPMFFTDTHTHLYVEEFDTDRLRVVQQALDAGINRMLLPNIDGESWQAMMDLHQTFPDNCFPMMGLHPTSVKENYENELLVVQKELATGKYCGVGEIGIDLYWDDTNRDMQIDAFRKQLQWAKKHKLGVSIHTRNAFELTHQLVKEALTDELKGVFHCFTGNRDEARKIMDMGFKMGIGGIVTFKNSGLDKVVKQIPMEFLLLETDSPYLTPVPFRGKRNQSAYIQYIAEKVAGIKEKSLEEVAEITNRNAEQVFSIET